MFRLGPQGPARVVCVLAGCLASAPGQTSPQKPVNELERFNQAVDALIRKVAPSVVQIVVAGYGPVEQTGRLNTGAVIGRQRTIGSGFVIDSAGYIITNAHVVSGAQRVEVVLPTVAATGVIATAAIANALSTKTNIVPAEIVGVARDVDLAVLKVDNVNLPALPLAAYRDLRQGELVFAFGSPNGLRNTVTHGVVSAVARQGDLDSPQIFIQTDAPINPGNSGGPLVNIHGEVVGIDTSILSQSGGNEGLGFAVPCATIRVAYRQIRQYGRLRRQEIGIGIQTITPMITAGLSLAKDYGVIVSDVIPRSPAEAAGVMVGDVLLSVDDQPADDLPTVSYYFLLRDSGERVKLEVLRGTTPHTFHVAVQEENRDIDQVMSLASPEKNLVPALGILGVEIDKRIAPLLPELRNQWGIIAAARTGGAGEVPLVTGDVIRSVNGLLTATLDGLRNVLKGIKPGDPIVLQIQRDGKLMYVSFSLE